MKALTWLCGVVVANAAAGLACAQPLDGPSREAVAKGDWAAAAQAIRQATKNKPQGESAFWLVVALGERGDGRGVTQVIEPLWDAGALDRALTAAMFRYATVGWLRSFDNDDFYHAVFDAELCCELIRARSRAVRNLLADDPPITDGANTEAERLIDAYERLLLIVDVPPAEIDRLAGFAMSLRGQHARAVPLLRRALSEDVESWDVWLDLAVALFGAGERDEARTAFGRAKELAPAQDSNSRGGTSRRSACGLAWARTVQKTGHYGEAIEAYRAILKEQPEAEGVRHLLGEAAYRAGDLGLAVWAYTDSLALDGVAESAAGLAQCWLDMGNASLAKVCIERAGAMIKAQERKPVAEVELLHGQVLWELGDKPGALKHYEAAYKAAPRNMEVARAAFQAFLAADDVYGALDVCRSVGNYADVDVAMEGVQEVLRRWPTPRMADMRLGKPMSHVGTAQFLMADLCWWSGRSREGVEYLRMGRGLTLPRTAANASWMLLTAGNAKEGARAAGEAIKLYEKDGYWADHNRLALAVVRAHEGAWDEAVKAVEGVKAEAAVRRAGVVRYFAAKQGGKGETQKPDLFNELGVVDGALRGDGFGIEVLNLLPGSPLLAASPPLRWRDRVYHIEGVGWVGSAESVKKLRAAPVPEGPVKMRFLRDGERYETVVTFAAAPATSTEGTKGGAK